ncbi:hypothetical protein AHiyo4_25610 [Arthrobacter sp. Hiyo4]|nr:hypothetical protein AHiyo4_25610 [Arthrobacter sp. Hiyo4]
MHRLGIRTNAVLSVYPHGVLFDRTGAPALYIPAGSLTAVRQESGMAGKFVEKDGLLVLTWDLGTHQLDTASGPVGPPTRTPSMTPFSN